jgi:ATP-binding cassette subfamily B multidrug efflux pump
MSGQKIQPVSRPDHILSYFKLERWSLTLVTISGILYNVGMIAGPYFEGRLAQCLFDIMGGRKPFSAMLSLAAFYLIVILAVQGMRCVKRFYVRRFANNTSRNMRHMLYNSLVNMSRDELERESIGTVMTKAVSDVDACTEGMRKFTTEVFDTGVVLIAYFAMLLYYDWRLALISCTFTPIAYYIAGRLKQRVTQYNGAYKKSAERLNGATMDRVSNAVSYRIYGCDENRDSAYEENLGDYEKCAVAANFWENTMQPLYHIISMCGVIFVLYLGGKNVAGAGWSNWNIAAFTTFLSCFSKMALKSSKAAKLFNSVQKAQVSWTRIKPLMKEYVEQPTLADVESASRASLKVRDLSLRWENGPQVLHGISFCAEPGEIIGVTGAVASGKSTLGKALLGELPYEGSVEVNGRELRTLSLYERSLLLSYLGHEPELMTESIEENIRLGEKGEIAHCLQTVCLADEITKMPQGAATSVGSGGIRLSGGQQSRLALARTCYHARQILILDDPFSAVDQKTEREIFANLRLLTSDRIIILISHRLQTYPQLDHVLFLENGTGVFSTHWALMRENSAYKTLYQAQATGGADHEE